jgi:hypothetical protein
MKKYLSVFLFLSLIIPVLAFGQGVVTKGPLGAQDMHLFDGISPTFTRPSSIPNRTITLNSANAYVDALITYGGGVSYTAATLSSACQAIGTVNQTTVAVRPGVWVIPQNLDLSAFQNITFYIMPGAYLSHGSFTLNIPNPNAGAYQWLIGTGQVIFSGKLINPDPIWFGADVTGQVDSSAAIQLALNSLSSSRAAKARVSLVGTFLMASPVLIPSYTILDLTEVKITATATPFYLSNSDGTSPAHDVDMLGGYISGGGGAYSGIWGKGGLSKIRIEDVTIANFGTGSQQGVYLRGSNITVINNFFSAIGGVPILCGKDYNDTFAADSIQISGNFISVAWDEDSICLDNATQSSVINNFIQSNHLPGRLKLFGVCERSTIAFNKIYDSIEPGIIQLSVGETGLPTDSDILYNIIKNPAIVTGTSGFFAGGNVTYQSTRTKVVGNSFINVDVGVDLFYSDYARVFDNVAICNTGSSLTGATNYLIDRNLGITDAP